MNKKGLLLAISSMSCLAVVGATLFVAKNNGANAFALNRGVGGDYTLVLSEEHQPYAKTGNEFAITNANGNEFVFAKQGNPAPELNVYPHGTHASCGRTFESAVIHYYGNHAGTLTMFESFATTVNEEDPINGIQSITVDYETYVGTYPELAKPRLSYGFVDDGAEYYVYEDELDDNVSFNFNNLLPNCFKIEIDSNGGWYMFNIVSITINYSCSASDTLKNHYFNNEYFDATPKNIVRDGEDNIVSFESGAYPQSKAESEVATYLEAHYEGMTPINTYYPYGPYLYARTAAWTTGYQNEYEYGIYYWFKVEPVKWLVLSHEGTSYFVMSEKAIQGDLRYNSSSSNVNYSNSTLKTSVDNMYNVMFKNADSLIATREKYTVSAIDYPINSKLYALSQSDYEGYSTTVTERKALPTEYTRSTMNYNNIDTLDKGATYWTNRVNYGWNGKNCAIGESGVSGEYEVTMPFAVRPGMTITIA